MELKNGIVKKKNAIDTEANIPLFAQSPCQRTVCGQFCRYLSFRFSKAVFVGLWRASMCVEEWWLIYVVRCPTRAVGNGCLFLTLFFTHIGISFLLPVFKLLFGSLYEYEALDLKCSFL